ncbi:MAG: hypothetical protein P4L41_10420 [Flavipsychrobacter sp.]|nr:hypothetical protein [Flavipsychrobacter sp.]
MKKIVITLSACMLLGVLHAQPRHKHVAPPPPRPAPTAVKSKALTPAQRSVGRAPLPPSPPPPPLAPHP